MSDSEHDDVELRAKKMGWQPQEEFKGDPEKWRPAAEYVERGETFLPIVKAENAKLLREVDKAKADAAEAKRLFTASQEAIAELQKFHTEDTARQVAKAKADLKAGIRDARKEGDSDREDELREQLDELSAAAAAAPPVAPAPTPPQPAIDPAFIDWRRDNDWFEQDDNKTALMMAAAQRLRKDPANNTLVGRDFYDRAAYEAETVLNGRPGRSQSKTDAGRPRPQGGGEPPPSRRLYSDLPADARTACDKLDKKLVGEGKAFKDQGAWRKHYVEQYFAGEKA